jgi:5-methylcytosine-specific restriction protein A
MSRNFSAKTEDEALEIAKGCCEECGGQLKPGKIRFHHRKPVWKGGDNSLSNCKAVCVVCHLKEEMDHDFDNMRTADRKAKVKKQLVVADGDPEIARRFGIK